MIVRPLAHSLLLGNHPCSRRGWGIGEQQMTWTEHPLLFCHFMLIRKPLHWLFPFSRQGNGRSRRLTKWLQDHKDSGRAKIWSHICNLLFIAATACLWAAVQEESTADMVLPWTNSVILVNSFYLFRTQLFRAKLLGGSTHESSQMNQMGTWGIAKSEFWEHLPGDDKWLRKPGPR